ncbi:uncharacterized protein N0V89_012189 [Didymosphaeria variabile]|uniref:Uncharacterized protein n=1 Tax=Didymosphaeria variabile TaxID=1932322 RepID=A0A9W8X8P6_9PLEO|nr:uncharacterized protein N0V89_012189 [Didymosphaeria variabile]KAJ4344447.1 hypothetical protein N0V89_012189 [Didymosphaeria variabile]
MDAALSRKRSRLALDDDAAVADDSLKRSRTQGELEELDVIPPAEAWTVDVAAMLASKTLAAPPGSSLRPHNNAHRLIKGSLLVLSVLPQLYALSPSLQALVLCRDPSTHMPSAAATYSLPLIQAVGPGYNHFVRLGLLHPLGGGEHPLDALVVIDGRAKRRLVLPFGWGAGKHADTSAGHIVQMHLVNLLTSCVEMLARE